MWIDFFSLNDLNEMLGEDLKKKKKRQCLILVGKKGLMHSQSDNILLIVSKCT